MEQAYILHDDYDKDIETLLINLLSSTDDEAAVQRGGYRPDIQTSINRDGAEWDHRLYNEYF